MTPSRLLFLTGLVERLALHLAVIIEGLTGAIDANCPRDERAVYHVMAWDRLRRLSDRFTALARAIGAGRFRGRGACGDRLPPLPPPMPPPFGVPRTVGWVLPLAPETEMYRGQVLEWLADPGLAEVVAVAPRRAAGILRPLCRMLGIEPSAMLDAASRAEPAGESGVEPGNDFAAAGPAADGPEPSGDSERSAVPLPELRLWPADRPLESWSDDELRAYIAFLEKAA